MIMRMLVSMLILNLLITPLKASEQEEMNVGFVLDITGTWTVEDMKDPLRKGQALPANRKIRPLLGKAKAPTITIIPLDGSPAIVRNCKRAEECTEPIELHNRQEEVSTLRKILSAMQQLVAQDPERYTRTDSRGRGTLCEAVLRVSDNRIDFGPVFTQMDAGMYKVSLESLHSEGNSHPETLSATPPLSIDWNPQSPSPTTVTNLSSGLYRLTLLEAAGTEYETTDTDAWVFLSDTTKYERQATAFRDLEHLTQQWGEGVSTSTRRSFLRAGLESLVTLSQ